MSPTAPPSGPPARRALLSTALGLLLSVALLAWSFRGVDVASLMVHLRTAKPVPVLLAVLASVAVFPLRMARWRQLLFRSGDRSIDRWPAWHALTIGYMANTLLPLRAGELLRAATIARLQPVSLTAALVSVAVERVFDAIVVVLLLVAGLALGGVPPGATVAGLPVAAVARNVALLGIVGIAGAAVVLTMPGRIAAQVRRTVRQPVVAGRIVRILEELHTGIRAIATPGRVLAVTGWSLAVWLVNAGCLYLLLPGFGIAMGFGAAMVMQAVIVFGIAVPSSPGFVGVYHAAVVAVLSVHGIPGDQAMAYALTSHVIAFAPVTLLGLLSASRVAGTWASYRSVTAGPA